MHLVLRSLALVLLLLATSPRTFAAADDHDRWYVLEMQGQRSGWMHDRRHTEGDRVVSTTKTTIKIKRGPVEMEIAIDSEFVETAEGKPVSMKNITKMGAMPQTAEYRFGETGVEVMTSQGGASSSETKPLPEGAWLTPAAASEYVRKRLESGAAEIIVRSIDPSTGITPSTTTYKVAERTKVQALGKTVPAIKWTSVNELYPNIESTEYVDDRGVPIRTEVDMGEIKMTVLLADKDLALAELDPPEIMVSTFVSPQGKIENPREMKSASYIVMAKKGKLSDLPATAAQRVERINEGSVRVVVDLARPQPADPGDAADKQFTGSSSMISAEDAEIRRLAAKALEGVSKAPAVRAEALRRFTFDYIDGKSLEVGFGTASEVARTRAGDCSEHGVFLAALLRAAGIPARVASGLIYADAFAGQRAIFGYHMWAQALLEIDGQKCWVDLDGTLPPDCPTDATHIIIAVASLSDDEARNPLVELAPMIGNLEIKVEKRASKPGF